MDVNLDSKTHITLVGVLACYQGESYILQQLESITESAPDAHTIIRDESDTESCRQMLVNSDIPETSYTYYFASEAVDKGHLNNFRVLCNLALNEEATHYFFSDQDDIFHKNKFSTLIAILENSTNSKDDPALIHSDLNVVDDNLDLVSSSFIKYQGLPNPDEQPIYAFLHQNVVTGCASVFNRKLLEIANPIPESAVIHDHWFGLCAKYFGVIKYYDKPLVDYRQHTTNSIGATPFANQRSWLKPYLYKMIFNFPIHLSQAIEQAKALESRRQERELYVDESEQYYVHKFSRLKELSVLDRLRAKSEFFRGERTFKEHIYLSIVLILIPIIPSREHKL
jgi:hypothetical protein